MSDVNLGFLCKMGPMAQHGPDLAQHKPKMGPRWLNMGPTWPNMGTTCAQHRPRLLPYRQALRIMPASVQHSPPWVCAENLGPIFPHHKPKVVAWPAPGCQAQAFKYLGYCLAFEIKARNVYSGLTKFKNETLHTGFIVLI